MKALFLFSIRSHLLLYALVSGLTLLALYYPMFEHEPVLDDFLQVKYVETFDHWSDVFQNCSQGWFRPFKNIVFYLTLGSEGDISGTKIAQWALLYGNGLLTFFLLKKIFNSGLWAAVGALLLVLNPTMVSNTQFLSVCNNQCCLGFLILYLYLGIRYFEKGESPKGGDRNLLFGSLLSLILALASYEAAVSAIGILVVLGIGIYQWPFIRSRRIQLLSLSSIAITGFYLVIRQFSGARGDFISPSLPTDVTSSELMLRAPYYLWQHFLMWVSPWGRGGVFIDDDPRSKLMLGLVSWVILIGVILLLIRLLNSRYRLIASGILIFIGAFVPLGNFLGLGNGPLCNYYLILPSLGLVLAFTEGFRRLVSRFTGRVPLLVLIGLAILFMGYLAETRYRVIQWQSDLSLSHFTLQNYPKNYHALTRLGQYQLNQGNIPEALERLQKARELAPWYIPAVLNEAYAYAVAEDLSRAIQILQEFNTKREDAPWVTMERLAEYYLLAGRFDQVNALVPELLAAGPVAGESCRFHINLVVPWLLAHGRVPEAIQLLEDLEGICWNRKKFERRRTEMLEELRSKSSLSPSPAGP